MASTEMQQLMQLLGIGTEYVDAAKVLVTVPENDRIDVLKAIVPDLSDQGVSSALKKLEWEQNYRLLPPVCIARVGQRVEFPLNIPRTCAVSTLHWRIQLEDGGLIEGPLDCREGATDDNIVNGVYRNFIVSIESPLPAGYHHLEIVGLDERDGARMPLIVAPAKCYRQQPLLDQRKLFGLSVQLYSLRSFRNWGIGDFTDLKNFITRAAAEGIDIVGLNPLHALFPANPQAFSPYSPSNRSFINVMYIDPQAVAEYDHCGEAKALVESESFQVGLQELRATENVDYSGAASCKFRVLEILFENFAQNHLASDSERAAAYNQFLEEQGAALEQHAVYDALHEYFFNQDMALWGWPVWPEGYRNPNSPQVRKFTAANSARVEYFKYLQWCAFGQLKLAQQAALDGGMAVGIYLDLAVGNDPSGSEAWANQRLFCDRSSAGAPPDELATKGQDWGFKPTDPQAMREDAYKLFACNIRANMRYSGAVRFDHCVSLMRLWWVPAGNSPREGAYVEYPIDEIIGVLALESHRSQCMVIGEDMGTVPEELPRIMDENAIYGYRVLYFETEPDDMVPPDRYPERALATINTHDMSPLISWWDLSDLKLREQLDILDDPQIVKELTREREHEKQLLLNALHRHGHLEHALHVKDVPTMTREINQAIHLFLASSNSAIMVSQLEDWMDMHTPVNVPGTHLEHKNWQRKMDQSIDGFFSRADNIALLDSVLHTRNQVLVTP